MIDRRPIYSAACPCCASTLVTLDASGRRSLTGKLLGPIRWSCAFCGFALMGLPVPVRPQRFAPTTLWAILSVLELTEPR